MRPSRSGTVIGVWLAAGGGEEAQVADGPCRILARVEPRYCRTLHGRTRDRYRVELGVRHCSDEEHGAAGDEGRQADAERH